MVNNIGQNFQRMKRGEQSKPLKIVHSEVCGPVKVVIRGRYNEYWK